MIVKNTIQQSRFFLHKSHTPQPPKPEEDPPRPPHPPGPIEDPPKPPRPPQPIDDPPPRPEVPPKPKWVSA